MLRKATHRLIFFFACIFAVMAVIAFCLDGVHGLSVMLFVIGGALAFISLMLGVVSFLTFIFNWIESGD